MAVPLRQCWVCAVIRGDFALIAARSAAVPVLVLPSFEAGIKPRQGVLNNYTVDEGASDLVLQLRVYEEGADYIFEVHLVYVP